MSVDHVRVRCECDKCGQWYVAEVDPADPRPAYDIVSEPESSHAVADMQDYKLWEYAMFSVVQENGRMLCPRCAHTIVHVKTPKQMEERLSERRPIPKLIINNDDNNVVMLKRDH